MAARTRSELARLRQGARNCSAWLLENIAPADVFEFEPARLRWGARHWRSSPLGSAGPETLHWAGPRMPGALNTATSILCAWYARVRTSIYIFSYVLKVLELRDLYSVGAFVRARVRRPPELISDSSKAVEHFRK